MAVLVVGGAGYIGSHVVRTLRNNRHEVVVFDNLEKGHLQAIPGVSLHRGDLRCRQDIAAALGQYPIDAVMHFSAYSLVGESMQQPDIYYENNLYGTLNLLREMVRQGVKYFIFSSTAAVYGEPLRIPIDEAHPTAPTNVYGETKLAVEKMLDWFDSIHGIKSIRLRYFNAAGADPAGDIGELHDPETHLVPLVLAAALGDGNALSIYGTDYPTRDGTCVRDYIHVNDLADAHLRALECVRSENTSMVFNLGNESGYSVREIIAVARRVTGRDIPVREALRRPGDPATLVASSEKIRRVLGWNPRFQDITTILATAWQWHSGAAQKWRLAGAQ